jgi:glycosyltransferase involved in cell wall biosynthesis
VNIANMNILLLNHYAGSPDYGMEFRPFYIAKEWVKLGHSVTILAADYSHLRTIQPSGFGVRTEYIDGICYVWIPTNSYKGNGISRVLNIFTFLIKGFKYLASFRGSFDHVIASSTYPLDIILAKYVAKDAMITFELHDIWPLTLTEIGNMPRWHPFVILMNIGERLSYHWSAKVVSMLSNAYSHVSKFGVQEDRYCYIPNGIDLNVQIEQKTSSTVATYVLSELSKLKCKYIGLAGYVGGHAISNNLDVLIKAATVSKDVAYIFIGSGAEKSNLQHHAAELDNVYFFDSIPKETVPLVLSHLDVLLISWTNEPLYRFGTGANKVFDYLLAKKPIVQALNSPNNPVELAKAGVTVEPGNYLALSNAVNCLLADTSQCLELGESGYQYVIKHHSYANLARSYLDFLNLN